MGILVGLIPFMFLGAGALAILAIVFGVVGIRRVRRHEATNRGMAIAGLIAGLAAAAMAIWGISIVFSGLNALDSEINRTTNSTGAVQTRSEQVVNHQERQMISQGVFVGNE